MQESSPGFRQKSFSQVPHLFYISYNNGNIDITTNFSHSCLFNSSLNSSSASLSSRIENIGKFSSYPYNISPNLNSPQLSSCVAIIRRTYENNTLPEYSFIFINGLGSFTYRPLLYCLKSDSLDNTGGLFDLLGDQLKVLYQDQTNRDDFMSFLDRMNYSNNEDAIPAMIHCLLSHEVYSNCIKRISAASLAI